jgi:hypothetical protein
MALWRLLKRGCDMNGNRVLLTSLVLLALACNEKKEFGGGVESVEAPAKAAVEQSSNTVPSKDPAPVMPNQTQPKVIVDSVQVSGAVDPKPKCNVGEAQITSVKLLTNTVDLTDDNGVVRYELSVLSCADGTLLPINDQSIHFDLNVFYQSEFPILRYSVLESSSSKPIVSGDLGIERGSDLFGKKGASFAHWVTEDLGFTSKVEKVILEIYMGNTKLADFHSGTKKADSFLRIGEASAVTQQVTIISP